MEHEVRKKIEPADSLRADLLTEIRKRSTLKHVSLFCGRSAAYFHQFIYTAKPKYLPPQVSERLLDFLGPANADLIVQLAEPHESAAEPRAAAAAALASASQMAIYSLRAPEGDGPTDFTTRPNFIDANLKICGFYIDGESAEFALPAGTIIVVAEKKPPRPGDVVLVLLNAESYRIATLTDMGEDSILLASVGPLARRDIRACRKILAIILP